MITKKVPGRRNPWRFLFLLMALVSALWLCGYAALRYFLGRQDLFAHFLLPGEGASIGIIGGADGPTAVFVAGMPACNPAWTVPAALFLLAAGIIGYLRLRKNPEK